MESLEARTARTRILRWLRARPGKWLTRLLTLAAVIGAITVVAGAGIYVARTFHEKFLWRGDEYAKLHSLGAGYNLAYFKDVLGPPVFSRTRKTGYTESSFRGPGYWVQALSFRRIVKLYAVTSCEQNFNPTFTIPGLAWEIELNQSTFSNVTEDPQSVSFDYRFSGATASTWFYETTGGGNPGYYKDYLWGVNDACSKWYEEFGDVAEKAVEFPGYRGKASRDDPDLQKLRSVATVNTYAETAPGTAIIAYDTRSSRRRLQTPKFAHFHGFHIGVDRLLVRTTE